MKTKIELENTYKELGNDKIEQLYIYSCLKTSGFDEEKAYNYIPLMKELWLKDENNTCISTLSDMLYNIEDKISNNLSARELLMIMYMN